MGTSLSKSESRFRRTLIHRINKVFKTKPSGQTTPALASSAPPSPQLVPGPDPNAGRISALPPAPASVTPRLATPAALTPARAPSPTPSASPPTKPAAQSSSAPVPSPNQAAPPTGVWAVLDTSLRTLHRNTRVFPSVQSAVGLMIDCLDLMQQLAENHDEREELASELTSLSNLMVRHLEYSSSSGMSEALENIARGIKEQMEIIQSQRSRGTERRLLGANSDEEVLSNCYRRIGSLFRELQADASLSVWKITQDQAADTQLNKLKPVHLAKYDSALSTSISRRTCTEGTRTAILSGLNSWSRDPAQAGVYWMNGMAGTGKTTIACTFSELLEQQERLAASFFCTRTTTECRVATRILPSIAYQLARHSIQYQSALYESLQRDPDIVTANISKQFTRLLKEPLMKVKEAMPRRLVVVVDALDECDNMTEVELFLSTLAKGAAGLPIKFFVTSRPEHGIYNRMMLRDQSFRDVLHLHEVEKSLVQADIKLYLQAELRPMSPSDAEVQELVERSGTLFIYAATLVRYIEPDKLKLNPGRRLQSVLLMTWKATTEYSAIDALYMEVLKSALDKQGREAAEVDDVPAVLRTVLCAQEPLSIESLTEMANLDDTARTLAALQRLRAVVHVSELTGLVSTLHASFPDFMFDAIRSRSYSCDQVAGNELLAHRCFGVMESHLRFNICDLDSSFVPDLKAENLDERVTKAISPVVLYACLYWTDHLNGSKYSESLCAQLEMFLSNRLLFWMEVMNLTRKIGTGLEFFAKARAWISTSTISSDVAHYIEDAERFVSIFVANPVSQSTPHIYISALPFCPKSSFVFRQFYNRTRGLLKVSASALEGKGAAMIASWTVESEVRCMATSPHGRRVAYGCENGMVAIRSSTDGILVVSPFDGHTKAVRSVALSSNGSHTVTGSADKTIRIWNTHDGTLAVGPLEGHIDEVVSVAYSPDDARVVSGSDDHTIRVWDAQGGALVVGPLKGHTKGVWAVAYSPDGSLIVSGSEDTTIRVWNATNGALVIGPLEGHTKSIRFIAYAPNGAHVASASYDNTIRVWNAKDGTLAAGPLEGHTDMVISVAYSPDGIRIVSGSVDSTIRVWNAQDGAPIIGPFQGHTGGVTSVTFSLDGVRIISGSYDGTIRVWDVQGDSSGARKRDSHTSSVNSVAYSSDGTRIVSGSSDRTIRVWHAHNGSLIAGPLKGHTDDVRSVAYSPAGTRIVSGSDDCTIRVWNAHDGALAVGPLKGHTDWVLSVGYSPDGTRIVSGSDDRTIRVWNAEDGTLVSGPLTGHTGGVWSVVYSPDGTRIASGSDDRTIRVWKAEDGSADVGPFEGHSGRVFSVAYSPDGSRIASGSDDKTIRVWNTKDGALVAGPFEGHTHYIWSVAYSPDGTRIVSGSWDMTIRVWNAEDGTLVASPFNGHTSGIYSVAYSPDGTRIVSGSYDQTIRVWSARDGVPDPYSQAEGHPNPETIDSVADGASTDASGWVTASDGRLLLWVPPEVQPRDMLFRPRCQMVIGPAGSVCVDYSGLILGRRWSECYPS